MSLNLKVAKIAPSSYYVVQRKGGDFMELSLDKETIIKEPAKRGRRKKTDEKIETVAKKPSTRKSQVKTSIVLQYNSLEVDSETLIEKVKESWLKEHQEEDAKIKNIELYIKPEEYCAYYVINSSQKGKVDFA